jgi:hypothetical protein
LILPRSPKPAVLLSYCYPVLVVLLTYADEIRVSAVSDT